MDDLTDLEIQKEIQKTLASINEITEKIRREVDLINETIKENGQYDVEVHKCKEQVAKWAEEQGLNVEQIVAKAEDDVTMKMSDLRLDMIMQKLSTCVDEDL